MSLDRRTLSTGWTLTCVDGPARPGLPGAIPATLPGTVHTDLLSSRLIPDPYLDLNEITADWIGRCDWLYESRFDWSPDARERHDLVFEGLDTFSEITLNDTLVGTTANMNRSYRFPVQPILREGENHLSIRFRSAWAVGAELERQYAPRPNNYPGPANLMRKMACNFGWDWGPTLVTAGMWKPVHLEAWSGARLASVRPQVTVEGGTGRVRIDFDLEGSNTAPLTATATIGGEAVSIDIAPDATSTTLELTVDAPRLWWPHGLGAQPLYDLELVLADEAGAACDSWHRRIGFRSIRLDTTPDAHGTGFALVVNDVPVYVCGSNWIPDDCFLPRVTPERYRHRIAQARDGNINLLRVWGGGIYETAAFYEACDEAGIMVWQDFLFACAAYPEEGGLPIEIEAEARENIIRLMPHPSLVLWNGNNENIWGWFDWGWQAPLGNLTWGRGYYLDLLPRLVAELDPTRPYWAGSPYSGTMDIHPNAPAHGCTHVWDVWNDVGYEHYRDNVPRFSSEFGWQAPPAWATLERAISDRPMTPTSPGVWHHQKATIGNDKLLRGLEGHLPAPQSMNDWHFATQLNQARAIRFALEHWRSHRGINMGAIVWQLNDCWPVNSWSAIDGDGRKKPLWYAQRAAFAPHLLTIQPRGEGLAVVAVNDRTLFWRGPVKMQRLDFDGTVLAEFEHWRLCADRLSAAELPIPAEMATPGNPRREFIRVTMHDSLAHWFFAEDMDLDLPKPQWEIAVIETGPREYSLTLTARTMLRDLCIFADRLHPEADIDDMLKTLLPGESHVFRLSGPVMPDEALLQSAPMVRCANDLLHSSGGP